MQTFIFGVGISLFFLAMTAFLKLTKIGKKILDEE